MTKQLILLMLEQAKSQLVATFNAVPDDKLNWKPLDNGRTALDLFSEAAQGGGFGSKIITSRGEYQLTREMFGQFSAERATWNREEALAAMEKNHALSIAAIEGCSEEDLALPVTMNMGGGMTMPLGAWAMMGYRTYNARFAQINYIQTLYGDMDSH